jgi:hypothetical protein
MKTLPESARQKGASEWSAAAVVVRNEKRRHPAPFLWRL